MARSAGQHRSDRRAVRITVVGQDPAGSGDGQGGAFGQGIAVSARDGRGVGPHNVGEDVVPRLQQGGTVVLDRELAMECAVVDLVDVLDAAVGDVDQGGGRTEAVEPDLVVAGDKSVSGALEIHDHIRRRRREVARGEHERVRASAASQRVGARSALQHIIAGPAVQGIGARAAGDSVVASLTRHQLGPGLS